MKNIFRQIGIILIFLGAWYFLFLFLSYRFYPETGSVDNSNVETKNPRRVDKEKKNIFLYDAQDILLGFWVTKHDSKRIILIGGSNSLRIRASVMQKVFQDIPFYHAYVRGSNITQLRDIIDVVRLSNQGSLKGTTVIVDIYYGTFVNDKTSLGHVLYKKKNITFMQAEGLRYGLYRLKDNRLGLAIDPKFMPLAVHSLRPFLFWYDIFYDLKLYYDDFWISLNSIMGKHAENLSPQELRQYGLEQGNNTWGDINTFMEDPQINEFVTFCKELEQSGASVVVVDLPIPPWIRERSEYNEKYILKRPLLLNEIKKIPRLRYIDLNTLLPDITDADFVDSVHPTIEEGKIWGKTIAEYVLSQRQFLGF